MFSSLYLNNLYSECIKKNQNEPEFIQAVSEFLEAIDLIVESDPDIARLGIIERLLEPERLISFRVPWVDDSGKVQVNRGYRVQFNSAIGPYKGGIRFDASVNQSIIKFLGFEQTFKNALTGLPMGGGKGGADFSPQGRSDGEIMRFCQSFMAELYRHIGPDVDVPAGDLGVGAREVGYLFGYYRKIRNEFTGVFTGKGLSYGGSQLRPEATGYGLCYFAQEMLNNLKGMDFTGKRILISGSGNVGSNAAIKAKKLGAIVVGMSDISGAIYTENGLDVEQIRLLKTERKMLSDYALEHPNVSFSSNYRDLWKNKADIALPCATQNEVSLEDAKNIVASGVFIVCEGANMPCTQEAIRYFEEHNLLFGPGKAANAGGVATSGLEMTQNSMRLSWAATEVDQRLREIMKNIYHTCYRTSVKVGKPGNILVGANIAGFAKVYEAMKAQGII
jgi:glutamate dehydrogenase (NADP+)